MRVGEVGLEVGGAAPVRGDGNVRTSGRAAPALALALALVFGAPARAQVVAAPATAASGAAGERLLVDTQVLDVWTDASGTVAQMARSPASPCASDEYVYERARPKWRFQTGRLLQAKKENAQIRVSFTCRGGVQFINAIQFLSPPLRRRR